jgi:SNF2 family DNA or RNA helicase
VSYIPHTKPFDHQLTVWEASRDLEAFAVFWEQGTGKSKLTIDTIGHLYTEGKVDAVIVVAPNGVHRNWVTDELPTHMPPSIDYLAHAYKAERPMTKRQQAALDALLGHLGLMVLTISYDAWVTEFGKKLVWKVMKRRKVMLVLDESHRIKTPTTERTRSILAGGKHAPFRRVLSGTPVTNGPFDIYTQVAFVDPGFWRRELDIGSYGAFKAHFGIWEKGWNNAVGKEFDLLVGYKNLEELAAAIKLISSRVTKDDVLDLPPKLYTKRYYEMSHTQRRVYDALEGEFSAWLDGGELVTAPLAITRMLRLQQVLCG